MSELIPNPMPYPNTPLGVYNGPELALVALREQGETP